MQTQLDAARAELEALREKTSLLDERVGDLTQKLFGKRSERQRVTSVTAEINKRRPSTAAERKAKRAATAAAKAKIESLQERPPMPAERCHCEYCGDGPEGFLLVGSKTSTVYSMPPTKPIKRVTTRDTWACHCGKTMVSAPAPKRFGRSQYDASVVAHLIVGKCTDALPVARQAEQMKRQGVPSSRATLNRIFLRGGTLLVPMANWIMQRIASSELVLADETPIRQQDQDGKGYFWVFGNGELTAYVYSPNRSGDTPKRVLGNSKGDLVVDGYTGYNQVTTPEKRRRSGCNAGEGGGGGGRGGGGGEGGGGERGGGGGGGGRGRGRRGAESQLGRELAAFLAFNVPEAMATNVPSSCFGASTGLPARSGGNGTRCTSMTRC